MNQSSEREREFSFCYYQRLFLHALCALMSESVEAVYVERRKEKNVFFLPKNLKVINITKVIIVNLH
jgi:hypothetical protein